MTAFLLAAIAISVVQLAVLQPWTDHESVPVPARISLQPHTPVVITSNSDFATSDAVRNGSGTATDPYIISDWEINASDANGIYITATTAYFVIRNVTISSITGTSDGIYLDSVSNGLVQNVSIVGCMDGVGVYGSCYNIEISDSFISSSQLYGIVSRWGATNYLNISGNNLSANGAAGISLDSSSNFNLIGNNISTDETSSVGRRGVTVTSCLNGVVSRNQVWAKYGEAFWFNTCSFVIVESNRLSSVWSYSIYLRSSTSFLMYHNNLVGTYPQAYDNSGSENAWNASYPIGGNYWLNYTGVDQHSGENQDQNGPDGIGDTPYTIDFDSTDRYPLMSPASVEPIPEFNAVLFPVISLILLLVVFRKRFSS